MLRHSAFFIVELLHPCITTGKTIALTRRTLSVLRWGFSGGSGKESACQCRRYKRHGFYPWDGKILWRKKRQLILVFFPGKSHVQRSLAGYSPWGHKESNTTEP